MKYLIGLILFLSVVTSQVTDKNFKEKIGSGFVVVTFTSEWQEKDLDDTILKGISGHEDAVIVEAKDSDTKKICKKLRIRNFPSIALFFDGSKKEVWKADMDGEVDVSPSDIKSAIDDVLAEDVF
jgi:thioredoxin-like negative regulator of GroEL|tara:strand:+ start:158 stop:532 length:375 start_codon:yes stop_codon:yes gene_type:complete